MEIKTESEYKEAKKDLARLTRQLNSIGMTNWGKAQGLSNAIGDYERKIEREGTHTPIKLPPAPRGTQTTTRSE